MSAVTTTSALNTFAFEAYRALAASPAPQQIIAPYAIYTAFAMVYAGASGKTAAELAHLFRYAPSAAQTLAAVGDLLKQLPTPKENVTLANALWTQSGYPFLPTFLTLLQTHLNTTPYTADFAGDGAASVAAVNAWVNAQTQRQITRIIESLSPLTRLVLLSAVTFQGKWKQPFAPASTRRQIFTTLAGNKVVVPMMARQAEFGYAHGAGWQAVTLPYDDGRLAMVAILPTASTFSHFEQTLTPKVWKQIHSDMRPTSIMLQIPRWESSCEVALKPLLQGMGVKHLFSPTSADLSGVNGRIADLYVEEARHQVVMKVDEEGTEASAATAVTMVSRAFKPTPAPLHLTFDTPFIYLITDKVTGSILFMGRYGGE